MNISRLEQETTIDFNAEEKTAEIYTADPVMIRKLDKLCEELPDIYQCTEVTQTGFGKMYTMPKKMVRFGKPIHREISEEQREQMRERAKKMHAKKS